MNLLFAGTPEIAETVLKALLASKHQVSAVLTQPDRPAGRGQKVMESPVKALASAHHLPIHQPEKLRDPGVQDLLKSYNADLMIVVAYGLIIPQSVLDLPKKGCWNIHVSLLPRWRGAAPIQRAIEAGDSETGVTLMQMDAGLDTGPVLLQKKIPIPPTMTGGELHDQLASEGAALLLEALDQEEKGLLHPTPQATAGVTYAHKLTKEEAQIDWTRSAIDIANQIRAFNPWPVANTIFMSQSERNPPFERASRVNNLIPPAPLGREQSSQRGDFLRHGFSKDFEQVLRIWAATAHPEQTAAVAPGEIAKLSADHLFMQTGHGLLELTEVQVPGGKRLPIKAFLNGHPLR